MRFALVALALGVTTTAACSERALLSPPAGFPYVAAAASCTPTDGPAVNVYFSPTAITLPNPSPPNVQIGIWRTVSELVGSWSLDESAAQGSASRVGPKGEFAESAARGSITVLSVSTDLTVVGTVDVTFPSGTRIRGGFTAPWIDRRVMCG